MPPLRPHAKKSRRIAPAPPGPLETGRAVPALSRLLDQSVLLLWWGAIAVAAVDVRVAAVELHTLRDDAAEEVDVALAGDLGRAARRVDGALPGAAASGDLDGNV